MKSYTFIELSVYKMGKNRLRDFTEHACNFLSTFIQYTVITKKDISTPPWW